VLSSERRAAPRIEEEQMLTTIQKIGPVLELFTVERPEWRMSEIARELGTPKSSAHSLDPG
jgi:hypothetical protein